MKGQWVIARIQPEGFMQAPFFIGEDAGSMNWGGPEEAFRFTDLRHARRLARRDPENTVIFEILKG